MQDCQRQVITRPVSNNSTTMSRRVEANRPSAFPRQLGLKIWAIVVFFGILSGISAQQIDNFQDPFNLKPGRATLDGKTNAVITTAIVPQMAKPGGTVTLEITVEIPKNFHIYSMSPGFGGASRVKFEAEEGVEEGSAFVADHAPVEEFVKEFEQNVEKYKTGKVTFTRKYKVSSVAKHVRIQGILAYQICNSDSCRNLKHPFEEEIEIADGGIEAGANGNLAVALAPTGAESVDSTGATSDPRFLFHYAPAHKRSKTTVRLVPSDAKPGDTVTLEIAVELAEHWHTFTTTLPEDRAATATELEVDEHVGLKPLDSDFEPDRPFKILKHVNEQTKKSLEQEVYEGAVIWKRRFQLEPNVALENTKLKGSFAFQVCDKVCIPAKRVAFEFPVPGVRREVDSTSTKVGSSNTAESRQTDRSTTTDGKSLKTATETAESAASASEIKDLSNSDCGAVAGEGELDIRDKGVVYVLGVAFMFGLLALLTPCVFPMVPITVSFFLKQAEKRQSSPLKMALVYSGSIILTFTVLGLVFSALFGATYVNTLANGIWLNLFLGLVLLFFSLNLLGLFDIAIPSWLLTFTGNKESSGGYIGVFFMALTFTLTSFTCTFAFLGLILVWAANGQFWWPLACLISFSTAFALPFFLLALFPSYLHRLPKSGGWMNRVKVVMGFIELAFMFKFLSVADIGWNGGPTILDYHMIMTTWMVLAAVTGLYLIGKIRLPHDTPTDVIGVFPMVLAMFFFVLAGYLGVGTFGTKPPEGFLGRQITAFAPPQLEGGVGPDGPYLVSKHDKQRYLLDFEAAKQLALREKKPLFVDFTGVNCINCRLMEEEVLANGAVQTQLENCVRVQLYCDFLPYKAVSDPTLASKIVDSNNQLQEAWLHDASLPSYVVVSPDGKSILSKVTGKVPFEQFQAFMKCGIDKSRKLKKQETELAVK